MRPTGNLHWKIESPDSLWETAKGENVLNRHEIESLIGDLTGPVAAPLKRGALTDAASLNSFCNRLVTEIMVMRDAIAPFLQLSTRTERRQLEQSCIGHDNNPVFQMMVSIINVLDSAINQAIPLQLPHPALPNADSDRPSCTACGFIDLSLIHRSWSYRCSRPLIWKAFTIIERTLTCRVGLENEISRRQKSTFSTSAFLRFSSRSKSSRSSSGHMQRVWKSSKTVTWTLKTRFEADDRPSEFDEEHLKTLLKEDGRQTTLELAGKMKCSAVIISNHLQ
ncbi:SETMAR [Cordylochernes scorpioides]|uniref:SETMAR n=1 Tax=Cordylochernes scorpioides TaxID=51811 RepID=A0ABY6LUP0_9ARAC|nr:SETMAR [Cordylochernes scorpioides]